MSLKMMAMKKILTPLSLPNKTKQSTNLRSWHKITILMKQKMIMIIQMTITLMIMKKWKVNKSRWTMTMTIMIMMILKQIIQSSQPAKVMSTKILIRVRNRSHTQITKDHTWKAM
jgi:hypothetical protein